MTELAWPMKDQSKTKQQLIDELVQLRQRVAELEAPATDGKRTGSALSESEERFRAIFESSAGGMAIVDAEGRVLKTNRPFQEMFGYTAAELRRMTLADITHPDDKEKTTRLVNDLSAGKRAHGWVEARYAQQDGRLVWASTTLSAMRANGRLKYSIAMIEDITERKRAEQELRESEERYWSLVELCPEAIFLDVADRLVYANAAAARLVGAEQVRDVLGEPIMRFVHPDYRNVVNQKRQRLRETGEAPELGEEKIVRLDGRAVDVEEVAAPVTYKGRAGVQVFIRDITERKQTEEQLRFQAALLDGVRESVVATDMEARVIYWSKGATALYGYAAEEVMQQSIAFLIAPDDEGQERERMRQVLETGSWSGERVLRCRDGTPFSADTVISVVKDEQDRPVGFIQTDREITEPKHVHDVVRASRERLRNLAARLHAVREEERTLIAREIHDELGQALTGLKMDLSWLEKGLPPGRTGLRERARSMATLIEKTLEDVRQLSSRLRPAMLDDLGLAAAIKWQAHEFTSRTGVECTLDLGAGELALDPDRTTAVFRIVQEALTNVARHAVANHAAIELAVTPGQLMVEVRDDGKGITEEQMTSTQSLGVIGMRERAGALGGRVHLRPGPEGGTVVTLSMPLPVEGHELGAL